MHLKKVCPLFIFCLLSFPLWAFANEVCLDLEKSLDLALKNNYLILEKKAQIKAAYENIKIARTGFLPKLNTSYGYKRLKDAPYAIFREVPGQPHVTMGPKNNYVWDIEFNQPIFTGFYLINKYRLSKLGVNIAKLEDIEARQEIIKQVKVAYFQVLLAEKYRDVARQAVEQLTAHVKDAKALYETGVIPLNDLLKSKVALANAKQELVRAENNLKAAISAFNILLALDVNQSTKLKDILAYRPLGLSLKKAIRIALLERPEIKLLAEQIKQMEVQIRLARSSYYPQIAMVGKYERIGNHPNVNGNGYINPYNFYLTLQAKWTFWEWGKTKSQIRHLSWKKTVLSRELARIKDEVKLQVKNAHLHLKTAERNIETAHVSVGQAKENYRITDLQYKEQVTTSTEVLDAQTLLTQAQTNYYGALYHYNAALAELERAMGKLVSSQ